MIKTKIDIYEKISTAIVAGLLYIGGIAFIVLFIFLERSENVREWLEKIDNADTVVGLKVYVLYGIGKLIVATIGFSLPIILTFQLIKKHKRLKTKQ